MANLRSSLTRSSVSRSRSAVFAGVAYLLLVLGVAACSSTTTPAHDGGDAQVTDGASNDTAEAPGGVLLDYDYGNTQTRSSLMIDYDGSYARAEQSCCPPNTHSVTGSLSPAQLSELRADVAAIAAAGVQSTLGGPTAPGSASGRLEITSNGMNFVVQNITPGDPSDGGMLRDSVRRSTADVARARIIDLVASIVDVDMPRDPA